MATFRTDQEAKKWESLSKAISKPLSKMGAGTATPDDLKSITDILQRYDALAADLFTRSIESAELVAHDFIDKSNAARIKEGKRPLSLKATDRLYENTFKKVLQASTEDIQGTLQDYFTKSLDEAVSTISDDVKEQVQNAFQKVSSLIKKNKVSDTQQPVDDSAPSNSIKAAAQLVRSKRKDEPVPNLPEGVVQPKARGKRRQADEPNAVPASRTIPSSEGVDAPPPNTSTPSNTTISAWSKIANFVMRRDRSTNANLVEEGRKATTWIGKVQSFFTNKTDWIVKKYKKIAGRGSNFTDKMQDYAQNFALFMMSPALIKGIADTVKREFDFDSIQKFIDNSWSSLQDTAGDAVDWVMKKVKSWLGLDKEKPLTPEQARQKEAARQQAVTKATTGIANVAGSAVSKAQSFVGAGVKTLSDPGLGDKVGSALTSFAASVPPPDLSRDHKKLNMMTGILNDAKARAAQAQAQGKPVSPATQNTIADMTQQIEAVKAGIKTKTDQWNAQKASAVSQKAGTTTAPTAIPSSVQATGSPVPSMGAVATPQPTKTIVEAAVKPQPSAGVTLDKEKPQNVGGVPQASKAPSIGHAISLGSFGMNAGDSSLFMLNLGIA